MAQKSKNGTAFFERGSWYHRFRYYDEDYLNAIIRAISKRTPSYGLKLYELFSMAFGDAFSECLIDYNPMIGVKRPDRGKVELHIFSSEQKKQFLQYAKCSEWYLEILLGMFCGLKKQEIYNLKFNDFNLNQKMVSICGKTKREITIPDAVFRELQIRRVRIQNNEFLYGERYYKNDLICCQKDGNYKSQSAFNNALKTICRKAGLPRVSVQDLRDMYADLSQIIKGHVLDMELLKEHSSIEPLDLPKEMEELLKEC